MQLAIAALTLPIVPGQPQVIIPCGTFTAPNGSLKGQGPWMLNDTDGQALVDRANAGTDIVVDYEHQTIQSAQNGQPAPAAGWLLAGGFVWQPDVGVVATDIRWTTSAADMIQEGEYRFISPVFSYSPDGIPQTLMSVALTNTPALTTLQELSIAAANNRGFITMPLPTGTVNTAIPEQAPPQVEPIAAPTIPVHQAALSQSAQAFATITNQLTASNAEVIRLRTENELFQRQITDGAKSSMITAALSRGQLMPGMEQWAMSMTIEGLSEYIAKSTPIAALTSTQTKGVAPKTAEPGPSDMNADEIAICAQLNIPHASFIARRALEVQA